LQPLQTLFDVATGHAGADQGGRPVVAVQIVKRVLFVELNPSLVFGLRHAGLPFSDGAATQGKSENVPKPFFAFAL